MTHVADVVIPEVFNPYVLQRTTELMNFYMGGIISTSPEIDNRIGSTANAGGKLVSMPFWNDLTGDDEVLSDTSPLTPAGVTSGTDKAALLTRGRAWTVNDLAADLAGDDPMIMIADRVADYKARRLQAALIATLTGVIADNVANDSGDMVYDASIATQSSVADANIINSTNVIKAAATMGDAASKLSGIAMHSAVFTNLQQTNQILWVDIAGNVVNINQNAAPSEGKIAIPTYLGYRVVVDDGLPTTAITGGYSYTCFLFGMGAVGFGQADPKYPVEFARDSLQGDDVMVTRWHVIMHIRGIAYAEPSITDDTPSNAELALATAWDRVYDRKNIRVAALIVNVTS